MKFTQSAYCIFSTVWAKIALMLLMLLMRESTVLGIDGIKRA